MCFRRTDKAWPLPWHTSNGSQDSTPPILKNDPALAADEARIARGEEPATTEGRKALAMRRWENLNPELLKYQLIRVADSLPAAATRDATAFARIK